MDSTEGVTLEDLIEQIETFPAVVRTAITFADEKQLVDVIGALHSTQSQLAAEKKRTVSEIPSGAKGRTWTVQRGRVGKRSYNTTGLLMNIQDQLGFTTLMATIGHLRALGVIKITWSWTNLEKLIKTENLELRTTRHEIDEDDPDYDMGEYWDDGSPSYKPIKEANT